MVDEATELGNLDPIPEENGWKCRHCDFRSTHTKKILDHTLHAHYNTSPWPCPICYYPLNAKNLGYTSKKELRAHISEIHSLPAAELAKVEHRISLHREIIVEGENSFNVRYGGYPPIAHTGAGLYTQHTHVAADSSICQALKIDNVAHAARGEFFDHVQQLWVVVSEPWAREVAEKHEIYYTLCTPDTCYCRHVPRHHHGHGPSHCTKCPAVIYR